MTTSVSFGPPGATALVLLALLLFAPFAASAQAENDTQVTAAIAEGEASKVVVTLEDTLLSMMKNADRLGFAGRLAEVTPVVEACFDLDFMAKTSIGRAWNAISPEQRERWVAAFTRHTTTKLADQFDRYSGQRFVSNGSRPASRGTVVVMSNVERPGKEPVRLDFQLRNKNGEWRIIDVYGKGTVSELALRRSEYSEILERNDIEGLIRAVDEHSDRTASKPGG